MIRNKSGIFLFNIIPSYRPGMKDVFDFGFYKLLCTPSLSQRIKQNALFTSFENEVGNGLSSLDLLYVMATDGTSTYARINWKDPGTFNATAFNSPTFTSNIGFSGNASNQYLDSGWDPVNNGVNFTLDECGVFCYVNNNHSSGNKAAVGFRGNGGGALLGQVILLPKDTGDQHAFSLQNVAPGVGSSVSANGFYHFRRVADNDLRLFKNGSQVGATQTTASDSLSNQDLYILALNANGGGAALFSDAQVGIVGAGASLTGKEANLYTAWNDYFSSL